MNYRKRRLWLRKRENILRNIAFLGLVLAGIIFIWWVGRFLFEVLSFHEEWEDWVSDEAVSFIRVEVDQKDSFEYGNTFFQEVKDSLWENISQKIEGFSKKEWSEMPIETVVIIDFGQNTWGVALEYKTQRSIIDIWEKTGEFKLLNEKRKKQWLYSNERPEGIANIGNWIFIAPNKLEFSKLFLSENSIRKNEDYKKWKQKASFTDINWFLNQKKALQFKKYTHHSESFPLWNALVDIFPVAGFSAKRETNGMEVTAQLISSVSFRHRKDTLKSNEILKWVPRDVILFIGGQEWFSDYQKLKEFLKEKDVHAFNILEFQEKKLQKKFPSLFDFLDTFTGQQNGFWLESDIENADIWGTVFGNGLNHLPLNIQKGLSTFQGYLSPGIETHEIEEDLFREDLVAISSENIVFEDRVSRSGTTFKTAKESFIQTGQISWSIFPDGLIFSSNPEGIESVFSVQKNERSSLQSHLDFSEYRQKWGIEELGIINLTGIKYIPESIKSVLFNTPNKEKIFTLLTHSFRNIIWDRKNTSNGVFIKAQVLLSEVTSD